VIMVGGGASLIRATLMAYVALLAMAIGRKYDALTALFFALLVYVAITPEAILYDVGLILSFLATLGIILLFEQIDEKLNKYISIESVRSIVSATTSVMITTTPFLVYTFGTFSLYGLLANILALPLVPILMATTFLLLCTSFIPLVSHILSFIRYAISSLILFISKMIAVLPFASLSISISLQTMYILYVSMLIVYLYIKYSKKEDKIRVSEKDPSIVYF
jgi:competence protein ComEC